MIGHLGTRVSDLLDGRLDPAETDAAWAHVHACRTCRDDVEREGYVKTRLGALAGRDPGAPDDLSDHLKVMLLGMPPGEVLAHGPAVLPSGHPALPSFGRRLGVGAVGTGALSAAVLGILALGTAPADAPAPTVDRRVPASQIAPAPTPLVPSRVPLGTPVRTPVRLGR